MTDPKENVLDWLRDAHAMEQQAEQMLRAQSRAKAQNGGTWSKSMTQTRVRHDGDLSSRTRSMAHQPGGAPAKSTTRVR